jgi:hypothetical protein
MKKTLSLLLLLVASSAFAGSAQLTNVLQFGGNLGSVGATFQVPGGDYSKLIAISSNFSGAIGATAYGGFAKLNSPAATGFYKVTTGKTFYVVGYYVYQNGSSTIQFQVGCATASFTHGTTSTPTGAYYYSPSSAFADSVIRAYTQVATGRYMEFYPVPMSFPADCYPFQRNDGGSSTMITFIGFEA